MPYLQELLTQYKKEVNDTEQEMIEHLSNACIEFTRKTGLHVTGISIEMAVHKNMR